MNWYPWLNKIYRQILKQYQLGRGHHALLVHSLDGCGDDALMYALGRWLMCQRPQGDKSCGKCHSCLLMLSGTCPDFYYLQPEKNKSSLGVESVRQVIQKLYTYAQQDGAKVIYVPFAEILTESATNALLKTLEEPPEQTYFLLGTRNPAHLLITLRSRCFYIYIPIPCEHQSINWLHKQQLSNDITIRTALHLTSGAPIAALKILEPNIWKQRNNLVQGLQKAILKREWMQLLPCLNHDNVNHALTWLCIFLLDTIKLQHGITNTLDNLDYKPLIHQLSMIQTNKKLHQQLKQCIFCRHQLLTVIGLNRELMLTHQLCLWNKNFTECS
ncbi:DNA polymerase III subunit delta' [Candidatus Profftia lariciata]|uniref:DNA polymerase III subunit delta' C-terminal domain-containing protein n=1 Tax=Candidatus Profftia lariciata TaxID=1987921 RepID=UPI001D002D67|nr:DNA polymerase III subunit delta' C-terminal domain-containing protein [Candidatus Profftia lariciata]UDG81439.1 DNA polymerase III subunit delta' [Candidatus Profftia lariciata]